MTDIVHFLFSVSNPFRGSLRYWVCHEGHGAYAQAVIFWRGTYQFRPVIFKGILSLADEIRLEPTENRREAYLNTIFNTTDDRMYLDYRHFQDEKSWSNSWNEWFPSCIWSMNSVGRNYLLKNYCCWRLHFSFLGVDIRGRTVKHEHNTIIAVGTIRR